MEIKETFVTRVERELKDFYNLWKRNRGLFLIVLIVGIGYVSYIFKPELVKIFDSLQTKTKETASQNVATPIKEKPKKVSLRLPLKDVSNELKVEIVNLCKNNCGNRGKASFNEVNISGIDGDFKVSLSFSIKYHQHTEPPRVLGQPIGGGFGVKSTSNGVLNGHLDTSNCKLVVRDVSLSGDKMGILSVAKQKVIKEYNLTNCKSLIRQTNS
jgi:hypothetical protein